MKKIVLFIFTIFLINSAYGQRQAGGWAIQGSFGIMGGKGQMNSFFGAFPDGQATSASAGASVLVGNKGYLLETNLFMNDYFVDKDNFNLPYRLYGLNALGGWSYEKIGFVFLNFKFGGFLGFEKVNNGKSSENTYDIQLKNPVNNFIYGLIISPELEFQIWNNLTAIVQVSQYWNIGSKFSNWKYSGNLGLKWYL